MEVTIVREPKGGPDVIFVGDADMEKRMLLAGDYLSVRGYTARVVTLPDGVKTLANLPESEQSRALDGGAPYICVSESDALYADATALASAALREIRV